MGDSRSRNVGDEGSLRQASPERLAMTRGGALFAFPEALRPEHEGKVSLAADSDKVARFAALLRSNRFGLPGSHRVCGRTRFPLLGAVHSAVVSKVRVGESPRSERPRKAFGFAALAHHTSAVGARAKDAIESMFRSHPREVAPTRRWAGRMRPPTATNPVPPCRHNPAPLGYPPIRSTQHDLSDEYPRIRSDTHAPARRGTGIGSLRSCRPLVRIGSLRYYVRQEGGMAMSPSLGTQMGAGVGIAGCCRWTGATSIGCNTSSLRGRRSGTR